MLNGDMSVFVWFWALRSFILDEIPAFLSSCLILLTKPTNIRYQLYFYFKVINKLLFNSIIHELFKFIYKQSDTDKGETDLHPRIHICTHSDSVHPLAHFQNAHNSQDRARLKLGPKFPIWVTGIQALLAIVCRLSEYTLAGSWTGSGGDMSGGHPSSGLPHCAMMLTFPIYIFKKVKH